MFYTFLYTILLTTFLYSKDNVSGLSKKALAVLNFEALSIKEDESYILTQGLISELINIGHYRIIERGSIDKILKEQQFQTSGCTNSECAVEIGQLINSDYVLIGTVSRLGSTYRIDARIIDVESGEAINSAAYNKQGTIEILLEGTKSIANHLSWF